MCNIQIALDGLENVLRVSEPDTEQIRQLVEEAGGFDEVTALRNHKDEGIVELATKIINYCSANAS